MYKNIFYHSLYFQIIMFFLLFKTTPKAQEITNLEGPTIVIQKFGKDTLVKIPNIIKIIKEVNSNKKPLKIKYITNFYDTAYLVYKYYEDNYAIKQIIYYNPLVNKKRINYYAPNKKLIKKEIYIKDSLITTIDFTSPKPRIIK